MCKGFQTRIAALEKGKKSRRDGSSQGGRTLQVLASACRCAQCSRQRVPRQGHGALTVGAHQKISQCGKRGFQQHLTQGGQRDVVGPSVEELVLQQRPRPPCPPPSPCCRSPGLRPGSGALSLEGVSQMAYILPERLPALVRPAFDLVLRRIRSLKRCVQA